MEITNFKTDVGREFVSAHPGQQVDHEAKLKAQVRPVEQSAETSSNALDEKRLRREEGEAKGQARRADVQKAVEEIQARMAQMGTNLQFDVDELTEDLVVKVTDKNSGDLIRQIPSEDVLRLRKKLEEFTGILFDERV